jgi:hypothetical protein
MNVPVMLFPAQIVWWTWVNWYLQLSSLQRRLLPPDQRDSDGEHYVPIYTNLYLGMYEKQVVLNPDRNPFLSNILLILRYLDDIFAIYTGTQEELLEFHAYLNSMNEHLHFSINYDLSQISFLGVMVIKDKISLSTDLYRKPADRNTLLRGDSFHPRPLIKNLTISQFSRIRRTCSSDAAYLK